MRSPRPGLWRSVARTWRLSVPAIALGAVAQTALTLPVATPALGPAFLALLVGSLLVAAATAWVLAAAAVAAVHDDRPAWRWPALGWAAATVVLAAASAVLFGPVGALVAIGGALLVVAATAQSRIVVSGRLVWWALQSLAVIGLLALIGFGLGFFVAGFVAALVANLLAGVAALIVLVGAARLLAPPAV